MQVDRKNSNLNLIFKFILLMQSVDALAVKAEEGRFKSAKVIGEVTRTYDPVVSEWGNLARFIWSPTPFGEVGTS